MKDKVAIIVVIYNSSIPSYCEKILSGESLFDFNVIVIDNTPGQDLNIRNSLLYIALKNNVGIALAQNIGIRQAINLKCKYCVFFDQDSLVSLELVEKLVLAYQQISCVDNNVAAVGPNVVNNLNGVSYNKTIDLNIKFNKTTSIISSGSVMESNTFIKIGGMMSDLFIDMVDNEWCWRASKYGLNCYVVTDIIMQHAIGNGISKTKFGFYVLKASPVRYYYLYRNLLILSRLDYVPSKWKYKQFLRRIFEIFYVPLTRRSEGILILKNIFRGIKDGTRNYELSCRI